MLEIDEKCLNKIRRDWSLSMIALQITSMKQFMHHLLVADTFEPFLLEEAVVGTACTFSIDGRINQAFYEDQEKEDSGNNYDFRPWSELKGLCFDLTPFLPLCPAPDAPESRRSSGERILRSGTFPGKGPGAEYPVRWLQSNSHLRHRLPHLCPLQRTRCHLGQSPPQIPGREKNPL